jgi:hypothetical protein
MSAQRGNLRRRRVFIADQGKESVKRCQNSGFAEVADNADGIRPARQSGLPIAPR